MAFSSRIRDSLVNATLTSICSHGNFVDALSIGEMDFLSGTLYIRERTLLHSAVGRARILLTKGALAGNLHAC